MYKIQTLNEISELGTALFDRSKYTVSKDGGADAVLVRSASMHEAELPENLLAIARAGAGVNNIPTDKCSELGICVFNTPGANANAVKELVIAGLLMASRKITDAVAWAKTVKDKGEEVPKLIEKSKSQFAGPEIKGKTLGVVGLGAIGTLVANAASALGMNVIGADPYLSPMSALKITPKLRYVNSVDELYKECDYVSFHLPYKPETKSIVNSTAMRMMKKGVKILNFARGELVNNADMLAAIADGIVSCYVTDFPNADLIGADGVIAIPHLGASTPESEENCAIMAVEQLIDYIENGNIKNSVNFPDTEMNAAGTKLCILHRNIPNVIAKITGEIAAKGLNIDNMLNKSKGSYACTLIDAVNVSDDVIEQIKNVEGIIKLRILQPAV